MDITINKSVIETILISSQSFLEKNASEITSHVLFDVEDNNLTVKATDYEIGISMNSMNIKIQENGKATANGRKLLDIIKILKDDDINLKTEDNFLFIRQKHSKFKLPIFNYNEFPDFEDESGKSKFEINSAILLKSIKKITPAIDTNNPKYELNGALIDIKNDNIKFVSTDTRRLAITQIENISSKEEQLIIPRKAILEIQKLFFDELEIYYDKNILIAKSSTFTFFTKLINGKFPDFERIIPKQKKYKFILNREIMIDKIKQVSTISDEIKLTFNRDYIRFESLNEENIEAKTDMEITLDIDEELYIATHSKFILDFLLNLDKSDFMLGYNDSSLPFTLESNNFTTVIMPIMI